MVDGEKDEAIPKLKALVANRGVGSIHALWSLDGLGALDSGTHRGALLSTDPVLRRNAIRALPPTEAGVALMFQSGVINDSDLTTRLAAFVALAKFPSSGPVKNAVTSLGAQEINRKDEWLSAALDAAGKKHGADSRADLEYRLSDENLLEGAKWQVFVHSGRGGKQTQPANEGVKKGPCLKIASDKPTDTSWGAVTEVKPRTQYRLSGKIKTAGIKGGGMGALFNVHELQSPTRVATKALKGQNDWTEVSVDFNSMGRSKITINALYGGWGQSTGTAWWDEVRLSELVAVPKAVSEVKLKAGDAVRGKVLFNTHPVAACSRCHAIAGAGGVIGPALDTIAGRKGPEYIRRSLLDPNSEIAEGYPLKVSPMPPMNLLLEPQEIEDILAYLQTLK